MVNQQLICELVRWFVDAAAGDVDRALSMLPGARDDRWDRGTAQTEEREKDDGGAGAGGTAILIFLPGTKEIDNLRAESLVAVASQSAAARARLARPRWTPSGCCPCTARSPPTTNARCSSARRPGR